jgi:hypothetical protein
MFPAAERKATPLSLVAQTGQMVRIGLGAGVDFHFGSAKTGAQETKAF